MPARFNEVFTKFLNDIHTVIPELENECNALKTDLSNNHDAMRDSILDVLTTNGADEKIATREDDFIENDFTLRNLEGTVFINIGEWWKEMSDSSKNKVWAYLNLLIVIGNKERASAGGNPIGNEEEMKDMLMKSLDNLKNQAAAAGGGAAGGGAAGLPANLEGMLQNIKNSQLGKLAEEMAKDINPADLGLPSEDELKGKNPQDIIQSLLNPSNTSKLFGMIGRMGERLNERIQNGELNQEELLQDAQNTVGNLLPQLAGRAQGVRGMPNSRNMNARERLRKKLAEKKKKNNKGNQ